MGMYCVDFLFECAADDGVDLTGVTGQEMDAFIGYGGAGEVPPSVLRVCADRVVRSASDGAPYDPESAGNQEIDAYVRVYEGRFKGHLIGVRVVGGNAVMVKVLGEDDDLPPP